ncbi:MAG: NAD(P)H-hydrate dehydratase [Micrococcales bacterium]
MVHLALDDKLAALLRLPNALDDKYSRGVVGFVTGSDHYPGAALLGTRAAQAISIGMVKYIGPQRVQDLLLVSNPEVVCSEFANDAGRANAWVIGSGVPANDALQKRNSEMVFFSSGAVAVVDAGALEYLNFELLSKQRLLLTPHYGELARLLNTLDGVKTHTTESIRDDAVAIAKYAATRTGQTILLKGSLTILATAEGEVRAVGPNSPHLATAGSGDVLAGLLGAIAAANPEEPTWLNIAELAVRLHSAAAELAAEAGSVTASTIIDSLGLLCRELAA